MTEELSVNVSTRISELESIFLNLHTKKLGKTISEFLREIIVNNIPKCQICNQFATCRIENMSGSQIDTCAKCAVLEGQRRNSRIVKDFFQG